MSNNVFGQGGLVGRSPDEITSLQQSLLPEGSRKHYNEKRLPHGTERYDDDVIGYEKVTIPPPKLDPSKLHARLRIDDVLDTDCARAFAGTSSLNPMQSTVFDTAFHRRENMLVCAPTGAGTLFSLSRIKNLNTFRVRSFRKSQKVFSDSPSTTKSF